MGSNEAGAIIKLIFREAKIHDAILFFDEAESIFMTRESGCHRVREATNNPPADPPPAAPRSFLTDRLAADGSVPALVVAALGCACLNP